MPGPEHENASTGLRPGMLAGVLGAGIGAGAVVSAIRGRRPRAVPRSPEVVPGATPPASGAPILGTAPKPSTAGTLGQRVDDAFTNINTAILDDKARPVNVVRRLAGDKAADDFEVTLRTMTGHAGTQRISGAINDGVFTTDGSIRSIGPRVLAQAYTYMQPPQQQLYDRGANAMMLLDDIEQALKDGVAIPNVNNVKKRLMQEEAKAKADPNVRKLFDVTNEVTRTVTKYNNKVAGTVSNTERALFDQRRIYLPIQRPKQKVGLLDRVENIGKRAGSPTVFDQMNPYLKKRSVKDINDRIAAHFTPNADAPAPRHMENLLKYVAENVKHGGENIARRQLVDTLLAADAKRGDGKTIVRRIKNPSLKTEGNVMHIWRNGAREDYEIGDSTVFRSMLFHPHYSLPYASDLVKLQRLGTTGALEPAFSWKAALYDIGFMTLSMRTNRFISGPIDAWANRKMTAKGVPESKRDMVRSAIAGQIRALDMPYTVSQGFLEGLRGRTKQELVRHAQKNLARAIGEDTASLPQMQVALDDAMQKYLDTRYSQLVRSGYTSQSLAQDWQEASLIDKQLERIADTQVARPYRGMLEAVRDSGRMGLFCRQVAEAEIKNGGKPLTPKQLREISASVREIAADPTRMGTSAWWSGFASTSMFANVIAQSTVHLIRCLANPAFYPVVASLATYRMALTMMAEERMGPDETAAFREETPTWRFSNSFPMVHPSKWMQDGPITRDDLMWMPLGMEVGALTNSVESVVRGLIGVKAANEPDAWEASTDALLNLVNINVPTAADAISLLLGGTPLELHLDEEGALQFQTRPLSTGPGDATVGDRRGMGLNTHQEGTRVNVMTDWMHGVMSTALGSMGATLADAIEATIDVPTRPDHTWFDKLADAYGIVKYDVVTKRLAIPAKTPIIGGEFVNKDSKGTPIADRYYELTGYLEAIHDVQTTEVNGRLGEVTAPSGPVPMMPTQLSSPELQEQVARVEGFFDHPARRAIKEQLSIIARREKGNRGNPEMKRADQARTSNYFNDQLQDAYRVIMDEYAAFEDQMKLDYGPDWSMRKLTRDVQNDKYGRPWGTLMSVMPSLPGR